MELLNYDQFNEINESLEIDDFDITVQSITEEIEKLDEGGLKQALGWTLFPILSRFNVWRQNAKKKTKIKKMLEKEKDPKKREALLKELSAMKFEQVKAMEKVKKEEEKYAEKAKEAKKGMTPEEKEAYQKQMDKAKEKITKAKEEWEKSMTKDQGIA
jgi:hypothetical protein